MHLESKSMTLNILNTFNLQYNAKSKNSTFIEIQQ